MKTAPKVIVGNWDKGVALDKHTLSSTFIGNNDSGHPQFDTTRTEVGEAVYQLKYKADWTQVECLAQVIVDSAVPLLGKIEFVVPVPATNQRARQPVYEVAHAVATKLGKPCFDNMVSKKAPIGETRSLKNLRTKEEKIASLDGQVVVNNVISNDGCWNVLVVDDLYDSGATLEEVCKQLRSYSKVGKIFVTTLTWR